MSVRNNHYDTLGVSKAATQDEIKAAFRKLSMATHPDVAKDTTHANGEAFKAIAEAHSALSSATERHKYDRQLQEATMWRPGGPGGGDFYGGNNNLRRPGGGRAQPRGMHVAMETLSNPRYFLFGVVAFGSVFLLSATLGGISSRQPEYHHSSAMMVEAWKNPKTGRWEQPAPWDPLYRQLKPTLELMPREKVRRRNM
jgi:curved DNA-binding protein CbpA